MLPPMQMQGKPLYTTFVFPLFDVMYADFSITRAIPRKNSGAKIIINE